MQNKATPVGRKTLKSEPNGAQRHDIYEIWAIMLFERPWPRLGWSFGDLEFFLSFPLVVFESLVVFTLIVVLISFMAEIDESTIPSKKASGEN